MKNKTYNVAKFRALCKNRLRQMNAQTLGSGQVMPPQSSLLRAEDNGRNSALFLDTLCHLVTGLEHLVPD